MKTKDTNVKKSIHGKLVDFIYERWLKKFLGSTTKLVQERFKGLVHSSLFATYILIPSIVLLCIFSDGFWRFMAPVLSVLVFSPIAYKLWTYRTTDRETQINFAYYSQGVQLVTSGNNLQKVAGIKLLVQISDKTPAYNEEIKHVFIETLKIQSSKSDTLERLDDGTLLPSNNYAQFIVKWLYQRYYEKRLSFYTSDAVLYIENQAFDLADKDCRKSLIWLLGLPDSMKGTLFVHFDNLHIQYKSSSFTPNTLAMAHTELRRLDISTLLESIKSHVHHLKLKIDKANSTSSSYEQIRYSELSELLELLEKEATEIRESMGKSYGQPTA